MNRNNIAAQELRRVSVETRQTNTFQSKGVSIESTCKLLKNLRMTLIFWKPDFLETVFFDLKNSTLKKTVFKKYIILLKQDLLNPTRGARK